LVIEFIEHFFFLLSLWLYNPLDLGRFFSFLILYTAGKTPWVGDQSVARQLPTHRTTQTQNKAHRHPCLDWDSNPRPQCSSGRRRFMPLTARPLWPAVEHLHNVTTNNYDSLTELHTAKITVTTAHIKSSQSSLTVAW
jgi:hypothetical protein